MFQVVEPYDAHAAVELGLEGATSAATHAKNVLAGGSSAVETSRAELEREFAW